VRYSKCGFGHVHLSAQASVLCCTGNGDVAYVSQVGPLVDRISEVPVVERVEDLAATAKQSHVDDAAQRYRWLMDNSPLAIGVHVDGRYVYVNKTLVRNMAAQSADQFIGRRVTDFVHPDSLAAVHARIGERQHERDTLPPLELVVVSFDGTTREVEALAAWTEWEGRPAHHVVFRDLTTQRAAEASLRFQAALVTHASDAIIATTLTGAVTSWNPAAEAIYGRKAATALGLPISAAVGADVDPAVIIASGGVVHATHRGADGSALAVRVSVSRMDDGYVVLSADQTALRRAEQHFQTVVASLDEGVIVIAQDGAVEYANPAALRILGVPGVDGAELATAAKVPVYDAAGRLLSSDQRPVLETLTTSPRRGCTYGVDRLGDGQRIWVSVNWSLLDPTDPGRSSVLVSFIDITEQHNAHLRLTYQATHDLVTGLPNRAHILTLISEAIGSDEHRLGAVLFIDMDKFKSVNDALGHHAGDTVLQIAAQRLRRALRSDDVVGRVGGDEFVALLAAPIGRVQVDDLGNRLHAALEEPIVISHESDCARTVCAQITASIGVVTVRIDDHRDAVEILRDADLAMYQAKTTGRATSHFNECDRRLSSR
jgi:diguanylate cyclase (GGDEF)-like protein/PAS domain S-box-containing protein